MGSVTLENWKGAIRYQAARLEKVSSGDQIVAIVKDIQQYPSPVRAKGSHHSTTDCIVNESGTVIDMTGMNHILEINRENMTIRMQAGVLHINAAKALEAVGLQFYVNVEIGNLTVGSGACGGTKDASFFSDEGMEYGQVASYCVGMKMVQADGSILQITEDDETLLQYARSSYGLLGIIFEVTFKVKAIRPMAVKHTRYRLEEFASRLPDLVAKKRSMMLYLFPFLDQVAVEYRYDGTGEINSDTWQWRFRNWVWKTGSPSLARLFSTYISAQSLRSTLINYYNRLTLWVMTRLLSASNSSPADQIIRYPEQAGFASYTFSIFAFPIEEYPEVLKAYFQFCKDYFVQHGYRCDLLNVGYYIAKDTQSLFSYTRKGDVLTLDPVSTGTPGWEAFLIAYNDFCSTRGGIPLFNQTKGLNAEQVARAFSEELKQFNPERKKRDPQGRFYTPYFSDLFEP